MRFVWAIARKDWLIEGRARDVVTATLFFAGTVILILGLALGPDRERLRAAAAGILWVAISFASILAASRSFASEVEDGALETLLLYPVAHELIYLGKMLANFGLMLLLSLLVAMLTAGIYGLVLTPTFFVGLILGVLGFSLIATFYAAITVNLKVRESLLPVLIFPLIVPAVLAAIKMSVATLNSEETGSWLQLLLGFDLIYLVACTLVFPLAMEA